MRTPKTAELLARKETIRALWAEGLSAGEIAKRLGCTRNAVIGHVTRMFLPARKTRIFISPPPKPPKPLPAPIDEPSGLGLAIEELTSMTCRYPSGTDAPYAYCGLPVDNSVYCSFHHTKCRVKPLARLR